MVESSGRQPRSRRRLLAWPALLVVCALLVAALRPLLLPLFAGGSLAHSTFAADWLHALAMQAAFTALVLAVEIPLGVLVALSLPRRGLGAGLAVCAVAWPLLLPPPFFDLVRTELVPRLLAGLPPLPAPDIVAWFGYVLIDAWRWTPLVILLCAFALRPDDRLEQAARIDGLSALQRVRFVHWPRMRVACGLAAALRLVDSLAAWPASGITLAAWVRARVADGPGFSTAVAVGLTLLLLALAPMPLRALRRRAP